MGSQRSAQLISLDDVLLIEGQPGIPQTARAEVIILRDLVTSGLPPSALQSLRQPPPKYTLPGWGRCGLLSPFLAFDNAAAGRILWLVDSQSFTPFWHQWDAAMEQLVLRIQQERSIWKFRPKVIQSFIHSANLLLYGNFFSDSKETTSETVRFLQKHLFDNGDILQYVVRFCLF